MELNNLTELELYFADHFDTVLFPVLAEIYQDKGQYSRAKKVCEIGLGHHPESIDGQYILSQAELGLGNLVKAEKLMIKILYKFPNHIPAASALPMVQEQIGRSKNTLSKSWKGAQEVDPKNKLANEFLTNAKKSKKRKTKKAQAKNDKMDDFTISPRLATFTLVHVLKGQELYTRALDVLDILEKKGENKERIAAERESIKTKF